VEKKKMPMESHELRPILLTTDGPFFTNAYFKPNKSLGLGFGFVIFWASSKIPNKTKFNSHLFCKN